MVGHNLATPWKCGSILSCLRPGCCWWFNGVGDIFVVHFGLQSTSWASIKCYSQPEHCCWPRLSFSDHSGPSSDGYFQQDNAPGHEAQIKNLKLAFVKWQWVPGTLADPVSRSQSSRATLRRGGWEMRQGRGADKSAMLSCQYGAKSPGNVSNTVMKVSN